MTKKEIVKSISEQLGLTQLKTKEIVQRTFDAIVDTLVEERRIELRNFGVFEVKRRAPRKARNPRTGNSVDVPVKYVVTFKPGKVMEERVRRMIGVNEAADDGSPVAGTGAGPGTGAGTGTGVGPGTGDDTDTTDRQGNVQATSNSRPVPAVVGFVGDDADNDDE